MTEPWTTLRAEVEAAIAKAEAVSAPLPPPADPRRIGAGWSMDTLHETTTGSGHKVIADRFRVPRTGAIVSVRWWFLGASAASKGAYAGGNGGAVAASLQRDVDGKPSGTVLARYLTSDTATEDVDRRFIFDAPVQVAAGDMLWHVIENTATAPDTNYFGKDNFWVSGSRRTEGRFHPLVDDADWQVWYRRNSDSVWVHRPGHAPILDVEYADGSHFGCSYMELAYTTPLPAIIRGPRMIRQRLTGPYSVRRVGVRLSKAPGTTRTLLVNLGARQAIIPASSFPDGVATGALQQGDRPHWAYATFDPPALVDEAGHLTLSASAAGTGEFYARGIRKAYGGYHPDTFVPGYGEYTLDGTTWTPAYHWNQTGLKQKDDWPYVLDVT